MISWKTSIIGLKNYQKVRYFDEKSPRFVIQIWFIISQTIRDSYENFRNNIFTGFKFTNNILRLGYFVSSLHIFTITFHKQVILIFDDVMDENDEQKDFPDIYH